MGGRERLCRCHDGRDRGNHPSRASVNLFFDLDGTLTDNSVGLRHCYHHALRSVGYPPPSDERLRLCYGPPLATALRLLLDSDDDDLIEQATVAYRDRYRSTGLFENEPYPGVEDSLQALCERGYRLRVVTLKADTFATQILDHFGLMRFFDAVHAPSLAARGVSKGDLVQLAVDAVGGSRRAMVMIGDRADDIHAAKGCGIRSIAAAWGFGTEDELRLAAPELTVHSMADLVNALSLPHNFLLTT
jgi:phosphoglycolate phosphatase